MDLKIKYFLKQVGIFYLMPIVFDFVSYGFAIWAHYNPENFHVTMAIALTSSFVAVVLGTIACDKGLLKVKGILEREAGVLLINDFIEPNIRHSINLRYFLQSFSLWPMIMLGLLNKWHWIFFISSFLISVVWHALRRAKEKQYSNHLHESIRPMNL